MSAPVRVRIAPSPTGDPHVGTAYIALFNYVFAKQQGGKFILRIEDTDQQRSNKASEQMIFDALKWIGLEADEGPHVGGAFGPYRQSERKETGIYSEHAQLLIDKKAAYPCFCTSERLQQLREKQKEEKTRIGYDGHCRHLKPNEVEAKKKNGEPFVVRLHVPDEGVTEVVDVMRGGVQFDNVTIDDQVLMKTDGYPTYHMASVVDDHAMEITHVIRAEEWISSTPKHVRLYAAFGWEQPQWIHMPLLRNKDKSKISKRKNPVSLNYYREAGYMPQALCNFLALMGFSHSSGDEQFNLAQMAEELDFKRVTLGGPIFDVEKLNWLNGCYVRALNDRDLCQQLQETVFDPTYVSKIVPLVRDRLEKFDDFIAKNSFFFIGEIDYRDVEIVPKTRQRQEVIKAFSGLVEQLDTIMEWDLERVTEVVKSYRAVIDWKPKELFMALRLVTTGRKDSPDLFGCLAVLGKERVRQRIRNCIVYLKTLK